MSLRTRLLLAIGVIALAALAIADVVTYSALQSFLYQRVDQQLTGVHGAYERAINQGVTIPASVDRTRCSLGVQATDTGPTEARPTPSRARRSRSGPHPAHSSEEPAALHTSTEFRSPR